MTLRHRRPSCCRRSIASTSSCCPCLLHDTGKARRTGEHASQSVELADAFLARLDFDAEERESILKLIRLHLEMSSALRRDIFDLENVRGFAEKIGSPQLSEDAHDHDVCRHQGRQSRRPDAVEGRESVAVLHVDGELHGPLRRRGSLPRRNRSHPAQPPALHGPLSAVRSARAVP